MWLPHNGGMTALSALLSPRLGWGLLLGLLLLSRAAMAQAGWAVQADGQRRLWGLSESAREPWRICALLPHGKDRYWWGVAWGLAEEGRRLNLRLGIYQANSYADLPIQRRQWADCEAAGAQAFIIAAIRADGLNEEIARAMAAGKPVIDLVNGVSAEVTSRSLVSFADMAKQAVDYLLRDAGGKSARLAWFPGPADAGWVIDAERGLMERLGGRRTELLHGGYGPTDMRTQSTLVRAVLENPKQAAPEYLLGNAVAVEFAARWQSTRPPGPRARLIALYATEEVIARVERGEVLAAPTDQPVVQARIAVDLAVRALEGQRLPRRVSPEIQVLDQQMLKSFDLNRVLPPKGEGMIQQRMP